LKAVPISSKAESSSLSLFLLKESTTFYPIAATSSVSTP